MLCAMHRIVIAVMMGAALSLAFSAQAQHASPRQPKTPPAPQHAAAPAAQPDPAQGGDAAGQPKRIGDAQGWMAYTAPEKGGQICYLVGQPTKSEPANAKRDPVHVLVTHNTAEKSANVVSFVAGYAYKDGSDAELEIGGKKFDLFTKGDTAWARDAATDKAIVDTLLKGKQAVLKGSSVRGTATTDTYALAGFAQAIGQIDKACNVKR
ncbi:MAG: hypothetical protein JO010_12535 [Alphaproteobacteria bacterium]|nr:hypothetical protein [Alphaproteobacteria bacterium]